MGRIWQRYEQRDLRSASIMSKKSGRIDLTLNMKALPSDLKGKQLPWEEMWVMQNYRPRRKGACKVIEPHLNLSKHLTTMLSLNFTQKCPLFPKIRARSTNLRCTFSLRAVHLAAVHGIHVWVPTPRGLRNFWRHLNFPLFPPPAWPFHDFMTFQNSSSF